jgi:hypothetical protein
MKKEKDLPKGFKCKCGAFHSFSLWVYAHWDMPLLYECLECRRCYEVLHGIAEEM